MVEAYLRQSALAHRGLSRAAGDTMSGAGITLSERPFRAMINLRGDAGDAEFLGAVRTAAGVELPVEPNTTRRGDAATALWLGPDEWLITAPAGEERVQPDVAADLGLALEDDDLVAPRGGDPRVLEPGRAAADHERLRRLCDRHEGSGAPPAFAINMGMVQGAVYDAVNAIGPEHYRSYLLERRTGAMASVDAAVATAAHDVTFELVATAPERSPFPARAALLSTLSSAYAESLDAVEDSSFKRQGIATSGTMDVRSEPMKRKTTTPTMVIVSARVLPISLSASRMNRVPSHTIRISTSAGRVGWIRAISARTRLATSISLAPTSGHTPR